MSHCEWRPIEEAEKYAGPIYVWVDGELVEAAWGREFRHSEFSWCFIDDDQWGVRHSHMRTQPKYYLAVTPPPEER